MVHQINLRNVDFKYMVQCLDNVELRLKPHHRPFVWRAKWPGLLAKYAHATESRQHRDEPVLSFQRNIFVPRSVDERVK